MPNIKTKLKKAGLTAGIAAMSLLPIKGAPRRCVDECEVCLNYRLKAQNLSLSPRTQLTIECNSWFSRVLMLLSLTAFFVPTFSRADVAATTYVDTAIATKEDTANKITSVSGGGTGLTAAATDAQYPSARAIADALDAKVGKSGDETIGGVKTFSQIPVFPTAPLPSQQ
jgi:hypothetical protein